MDRDANVMVRYFFAVKWNMWRRKHNNLSLSILKRCGKFGNIWNIDKIASIQVQWSRVNWDCTIDTSLSQYTSLPIYQLGKITCKTLQKQSVKRRLLSGAPTLLADSSLQWIKLSANAARRILSIANPIAKRQCCEMLLAWEQKMGDVTVFSIRLNLVRIIIVLRYMNYKSDITQFLNAVILPFEIQ